MMAIILMPYVALCVPTQGHIRHQTNGRYVKNLSIKMRPA